MAQVYVKRVDSQRPACSMRYALALLGDLIGTTFFGYFDFFAGADSKQTMQI